MSPSPPGGPWKNQYNPGSTIKHLSKVIPPPPYERAVQVHIWRNAITSRGFADASHPGHASLQIFENRTVVRHISWVPASGGGAGWDNLFERLEGARQKRLSFDGRIEMKDGVVKDLNEGTKDAREGQYRHRELTEDGRQLWMKKPEDTTSLPGLGAQDTLWGLYLPAMATWWDDWSSHSKYVMASTTKNCSGAVAQALKAGGADCYAPAPKAWLYLSPREVEGWAHNLKDRFDLLDRQCAYLKAAMLESPPRPGLKPKKLPTKQEWKDYSSVKGENRSRRLAVIDDIIGHLERNDDGDGIGLVRQRWLVTLAACLHGYVSGQREPSRFQQVMGLTRVFLGYLRERNKLVAPVNALPDDGE